MKWNLFIAVIFAFLSLSLLSVAANVAAEPQRAQLLVAPGFGQLADQAWDSWRSSVFNIFRWLPF